MSVAALQPPVPISDEAWERGIFETVRFMRRFSGELAEVFKTLDEILGAEGWECPHGNKGVVWGSSSYDKPNDWLCTFPMRIWERPKQKRAIQVVLDFTPPEDFDAPEQFQRPLFECGVHTVGKKFDAKKFLTAAWLGAPWAKNEWLIEAQDGPLVRARPHPDCRNKNLTADIIERSAQYFLPLRAIKDEPALRRLVAAPLLALAQGDALSSDLVKGLTQAGAIVP